MINDSICLRVFLPPLSFPYTQNAGVAALFSKLLALGLTEPMEAQLLSLSPLFINVLETNLDRISKATGSVRVGSRKVDANRSGAIRPQTRLIDSGHSNTSGRKLSIAVSFGFDELTRHTSF